MNKSIFLGLMFLLLACLVACNTVQNTEADISNAQLFIQQADGLTTSVNDIDRIQETAPFTIAFPKDLPDGVSLKRVQVSLPPEAMAESATQRNVRVLLQYGGDETAFAFQLTESIEEPMLVHPDLSVLEVSLLSGVKIELNMFEDDQTQFIGASWTGCGIGFVLSGTMEGGFTADWPPRIARSVVESCE